MAVVPELRRYPFTPFTGDLPGELLDMIETDPVSRVLLPDGEPAWLVLDYANCCAVLADPRFARLPPGAVTPDRPRDLNMDGPAHAAVRRVGGRAFTGRRVESYRPRIQAVVDELVDAMVAGPRPADLVAALVAPLPVRVTCELLGVPAPDREQFEGWLAGLNSVLTYNSAEAAKGLWVYLSGQVAAKRAAPGDDLLSVWLEGQEEHGLTDQELVVLAMGLLRGGLEVNSTAAGVRALFLHPEQMAELVRDPGKAPAAIDEILRYTAVSSMFRVQVVTEDLVLGGVELRAGERVMAIPWVANRDPRIFPNPNEFDIDRTPTSPHLAFGYGPHFCLGTAVARLQVELSITTLLRRLPGLAPAVPIDELPWRHDRINGGIESFPVVWRDDQ
ncbi:cytochrome P450 [Saccharothrix syringae]|uniref:Cytochrome P450 n=1 Tax=Saccharothrix syringae TaxID=103733 RepID=A0A5Q0H5Q4_SACSY|nr:cytochrome P450 [Saccharothrix syringae]QFZ21235.1 cytochrome P450 [Saccharothrix syringae]